MVEQNDEEEHYSIDEFCAVLLDGNSTALWVRLRKSARLLAAKAQIHDGGEELLQESITRVLEGRRPWPKHLDIAAFLIGTMKSIASESPKAGFRNIMDSNLDAVTELQSNTPTADGLIHEKQVKQRFLNLFEGSEDQILIIEGRFDGMKKSEFLELFDQDETRYQTACKGIRRKLSQHPDLKGLINGE